MMKKVLYGVAIALLAGASVGTLQSCKDDVSDLKTQTSFDLEQLRKDLAGVQQGLQDQITNNRNDVNKLFHLLDQYAKVTWVEQMLKNLQDNIYANITNIGNQIGHINGEIVRLNGEISTLQGKVDYLTQKDAQLLVMINGALQSIDELNTKYTTLNGKYEDLNNKYSDLNTKYDTLSGDLNNLKDLVNNTIKPQVDQNTRDILELQGKVLANEASISTLDRVMNQLQSDLGTLDQKVDGLDTKFTGQINTINGQLDFIDGKIDALDLRLTNSLNGVDGRLDNIDALISGLGGRLDGIDAVVDALGGRLDGVDGVLVDLGNRLDGAESSIAALVTGVASLQTAVNSINSALNGVVIRISDLEGRVGDLEGNVRILNDNVSDLQQKVYFLRRDLNTLVNDFSELSGNVDLLAQRVSSVEQGISNLSTRLDNTLTSLLIQAADSPVFGNFSLPLGIKSTLLFNWYGVNTTGIDEFPYNSYTSEFEYDHQNVDFELPENAQVVAVNPKGTVIGDVDLGRVYLTLNPVGHYFYNNPENFVFETSNGTKLPVQIEVNQSNEELTFGYSRDREKIDKNGFYAADVKIAGDEPEVRERGIVAARVEIDQNLKTAVKDVFKDRTKRSAVALLKAVYGQLDGMLPAYALRYNWADGTNNYSVLSNYDLAIATARPLSYSFYQGSSINYRLHKYGHINNILEELRGKFTIEFTPISFDKIEIKLPAIPLKDVNVVPGTTTVSTTLDPICITIDGEDHYSGRIPVEIDIKDVVGSITDQFNDAINQMVTDIKGWTGTANQQISDDLKGQLQPIADEINGMVDKLQGQIDSMIDDVINKAEPWFQRLNRVVDLYDRVADKVNNVLEDPNHYLQVAMFYNQKNQGVGMLSNVVTDPTPFGAGNGVITLYASSYSGEIVCPAFKKYVACTKVYDKNGNPIAAAQESTLRSKMNEKAEFFNKVMGGYTIRFDVPTSAIEKNYIYEITYQGLDYSGVTSTQKFYITVK